MVLWGELGLYTAWQKQLFKALELSHPPRSFDTFFSFFLPQSQPTTPYIVNSFSIFISWLKHHVLRDGILITSSSRSVSPLMLLHSPLHFSPRALITGYDYILQKLFYNASLYHRTIALKKKSNMCSIVECVSQPNQFSATQCILKRYLFNEKKKWLTHCCCLTDMLNIRCVSLSSDLIDLPHGCIKKKKLRIYFVLWQMSLWGFPFIHSFSPQTVIEHSAHRRTGNTRINGAGLSSQGFMQLSLPVGVSFLEFFTAN